MNKSRLENFSDGFFAIVITIMVLGLKPPEGVELSSIKPLDPIFLSYLISFIFMAIYWHNHHLLFQTVQKISSIVVWVNFLFLFWISLIPFSLSWIGTEGFSSSAVGLYGVVLFLTTLSFFLLVQSLAKNHGKEWSFLKALPNKHMRVLSIFTLFIGILISIYFPKVAFFLYALSMIFRQIPAHQIEKKLFQ